MEEAGWSSPQQQSSREMSAIRHKIDELDDLISASLAERLKLARELKTLKADLNLPIHDPQREAQVCSRVSQAAKDPQSAAAIEKIYQSVMEQSRLLQADGAQERLQQTGSPLYFPRVLIIGLGLIGGTLARQIKLCLPETTILAVDKPEVLRLAINDGVIDGGSQDPIDFLHRSSLVILAAHPQTNVSLLSEIAQHLHKRQVVIDVSSAKGEICALAEQIDLRGADFIGGHPFFGSEKSGFSSSSRISPEGKVFCLTPGKKSSEIALKRIARWIAALGMQVEITDPATHDLIASKVSHLVQLLAVALGNSVASGKSEDEIKRLLQLSGPSFAGLARLMVSPPDMWSDICVQNKDAISSAIKDLITELSRLELSIQSGDREELQSLFNSAAGVHRLLP